MSEVEVEIYLLVSLISIRTVTADLSPQCFSMLLIVPVERVLLMLRRRESGEMPNQLFENSQASRRERWQVIPCLVDRLLS
jgi:hypothetical protein